MQAGILARAMTIGLVAGLVSVSRLNAAPFWEATKNNPQFKVTTNTNGALNNLASEGGLGKDDGSSFTYVIDDIDNGVRDGLLPDKLKYVFSLTEAQANSIMNNDGIGRITVTAARDLGRTKNDDGTYAPGTEFMFVLIGDTVVPDAYLYKELLTPTLTTPPHTENGADLTKGPNFNSDVTATESAFISQAIMQEAAGTGEIDLFLDPTERVARLKIKTITLEYMPVPEPQSFLLLLLGGTLAALQVRRRK